MSRMASPSQPPSPQAPTPPPKDTPPDKPKDKGKGRAVEAPLIDLSEANSSAQLPEDQDDMASAYERRRRAKLPFDPSLPLPRAVDLGLLPSAWRFAERKHGVPLQTVQWPQMYPDPEPARTSTHTEDFKFVYDDVNDKIVMASKPKMYARDEADLPQNTVFNITEMIKSLDADEPEPKLFSRMSWSSDDGDVQIVEKAEKVDIDAPKKSGFGSVMAKFKRGLEGPKRVPHPVPVSNDVKKINEAMDIKSIAKASDYYTDGSETNFKARDGVQYRHHSTLSIMDYTASDLEGERLPGAYILRETGGNVQTALSPANKILGHRVTCQSTPIPGGGWEKRRARQQATWAQWDAEDLAAEAAREQEARDFWDASVQRATSLTESPHLQQPSSSQSPISSANQVDSADPFAIDAAAQSNTSFEEYVDQAMTEITPWQFSIPNHSEVIASSSQPLNAEEFKKRFPPPPIPDTPTRSAGRSLRSVKSDCSIRTSASGRKIAPPIAYPRRAPADVIIITPEKRPDLFIAKAKSSVYHDPVTGALYDTVEKDTTQDTAEKRHIQEVADTEGIYGAGDKEAARNAAEEQALQDTIEQMKESILAEYNASKSSVSKKDKQGKTTMAEEEHLGGKELERIGKKIIARASVFGFTPLLDWSSMTTQEVRAYGYAIEKELKGDKNKVLRMFKHVGKEKAQAGVQRHAYLTRQKMMAEKMLKEKLSEEKRAKVEKAARKQADSRVSQAQYAQQSGDWNRAGGLLEEALETLELGDVRMVGSPESKYSGEGKWSVWGSSQDIGADYGDTESERQRTYERLCAMGQQTPRRSVEEPIGLGITMSQDDSLIGPPSTRPYSPKMVQETPTSPASMYSPLSPFADPPMKVNRSSQMVLNQFGRPTFKIKRDGSFARRLEEQRNKRAKQMFDRHPALRLQPGPNSSPAVMGDIWSSDDTTPEPEASETVHRRPSAPTPSRKSALQSTAEDEGYATGSMVQHPFFTRTRTSDSDSISVLEYHGHLSHIHDMMQLRYPRGSAESGNKDEEIEYVDNPDYDASQDSTIVDDGEPSPELQVSSGRPTSILFADIDHAIQQWSPKADQTAIGRKISEADIIRQDFGLPVLNLRRPDAPKHPSHGLEWNTEKLMCYEAHASSSEGSFPPYLPADQRLSQTVQRCDRCFKMCCLFAESMMTASIPARTSDENRVRRQAEERVSRLLQAYPNGTEDFDTFLTCSDCSKVVCPRCATLCKKRGCCEVMCRDCGKGAKGRCFRHSRM